jgi:hypothetical protein
MTAIEELLLAGERLAEGVDDFFEIQRYPPTRVDYEEGEAGGYEFLCAVEDYREDLKATKAALTLALRNYRYAQQRELSARAIRGINGATTALSTGGAK